MIFSFPDSAPEKMWHLYATFKDPGVRPDSPIRRRRIEFNAPLNLDNAPLNLHNAPLNLHNGPLNLHNEREITAARSRGSNLWLSSIRARLVESGALYFQAASGTE
jgi:hypothetical protein